MAGIFGRVTVENGRRNGRRFCLKLVSEIIAVIDEVSSAADSVMSVEATIIEI